MQHLRIRLSEYHFVLISGLLLGLVIGLLGPLLAPYGPLDEAGAALKPPDALHLLGTDLAGRDVWSRVLQGGSRTLGIATLAMLCAVIPGMGLGWLGGYMGGIVDALILVVADALLAIPGLLVAMCVIALLGNGPFQVAMAAGIAGLPAVVRIARATAKHVRSQPYIEAARAVGVRPLGVIFRYIAPNTARPLMAFSVVTLTWAILNSATLHFLGFGGDPALPEWGAMLADARQVYRVAPWAAVGPGIALMLTLIILNGYAAYLGRQLP